MNRKKMIILTSLLVLIPVIVGLLLWNKLPERMPIHFNAAGEADNWGSKSFAVFGLPLILFIAHLVGGYTTLTDPKKQNISDKMFLLVLLIIPFVSVFCFILTYATALGIEFSINMLGNLFLGIVFIVVGNYLPKSRQNYSVGIKIPWTLSDTENWNKTHRIGGITWLLCGIVLVINAFMDITWIIPLTIFIATLIPVLYSFLLYKQKEKNSANSDTEKEV